MTQTTTGALLFVGGIVGGKLYEPPTYSESAKPKARNLHPCVDCGAMPRNTARLRKRCLPCYKEFNKTTSGKDRQQQNAIPRLMQIIEALPDDMREVIGVWLSRRTFTNNMAKRGFLTSAVETVTRAVECQHPCCAGMTRDERLRECREGLCK